MTETDAVDAVNQGIAEDVMGKLQAAAVAFQHDPKALRALASYAIFLLSPNKKSREYEDLITLLDWYGTKYSLPIVKKFLQEKVNLEEYNIVVELGPGSGWLVNGVKDLFAGAFAIDRRPELWGRHEGVIFLRADFEASYVPISIPRKSVVIANQFIHCINRPEVALNAASTSKWLIIEPLEGAEPFPYWHEQMSLFGATPLSSREIENIMVKNHFELEAEETLPGQWISLWTPA